MTTSIESQTQARDYLYWCSLLLVAIGLVISGYLSYTKLTNTSVLCLEDEAISCDVVQQSAYAKFAGIEIAYLGFVAYLVLGGLLVLSRRDHPGPGTGPHDPVYPDPVCISCTRSGWCMRKPCC